jgi:hypothetical protein
MNRKIIRIILLGILIWIIPFITGFAFYDRSGNLTINYDLFKSIMIVVSSVVSSYAILRHYKSITENFIREGYITGLGWLAINLLLDLIILVPMAKMQMKDYFAAIGVRYLQIPVICIMIGILLQRKYLTKNI